MPILKIKKLENLSPDPHSFSIPAVARVKHLHWKATVDFNTKTIQGTATWDIETMPAADSIVLDTKGLTIIKITLDDDKPTAFHLSEFDSLLGQALTIAIGTRHFQNQYCIPNRH